MNKNYDKEFNAEIERILKVIYYKPIVENGKDRRAVVNWDYKYTQYLIDNELIKYISNHSTEGIMLKPKGYEVFEKYDGWDEYRKKVIDKKNKIDNAKNLSQRFWWIPILISILALGISFWALYK